MSKIDLVNYINSKFVLKLDEIKFITIKLL